MTTSEISPINYWGKNDEWNGSRHIGRNDPEKKQRRSKCFDKADGNKTRLTLSFHDPKIIIII